MERRLKLLVLWADITGYTSACWRALAADQDFDLFVVGLSNQVPANNSPFADNIMEGINCKLLNEGERNDPSLVSSIAKSFQPNVVMVCGWFIAPYRNLCMGNDLGPAKIIMTMDTPILHNWRQWLAPLKIGRFLKRMDRVFVPGERGWQLARQWKFDDAKIKRGLNGIDFKRLAPLHEQRSLDASGWPKSFLFCGRYVYEKGVDVLLEGYQRYRASVADPWPLECCGAGPLRESIARCEGVKELGFVQPALMPEVWRRNGAFVLASRHEPWGQVITEAAAAGLPVLCTEACGASPELVRTHYNGLTIPPNDSKAVTAGLLWLHNNYSQLALMGARGRGFAEAYSAELWAQRVRAMIHEMLPNGASMAPV